MRMDKEIIKQKQSCVISLAQYILYPFVVYLYVSGSGSITSVWEERSIVSAVVYL